LKPGTGDCCCFCEPATLVDEIAVDLAPVLLGRGIRFFHEIAHPPVLLEDPEVRESVRVTHLRFRVRHQNA
jgi:hypothetical protein